MKLLCKGQRKRRLSTGRRTKNYYQKRIENHDQRAPQGI